MIRLFTLASVDLRGPENQLLRSVLHQPKRLALLAYLTLTARSGLQRRDVLLGLFWPESDQERARHALNQAIHFLRRSLGNEAILSRGPEEIGIGHGQIWCDALAFQEALEAGRPAEALSLYRGDFLAGLYVDGAPEFDRWMDTERMRLQGLAREAAWSLSMREERAGNLRGAVQWARSAAELAPFDEESLRQLITLLDRSGDRGGALHAFDAFAERLAREYEAAPSPETQRLIEAVRSRATPSVSPLPATPATAPADPRRSEPSGSEARNVDEETSAPAPGPPRPGVAGGPGGGAANPGRRARWRSGYWPAALLLIATGGVLLGGLLRERKTQGEASDPSRRTRIAVLPLEDLSGTGELGYLADALSSTLTDQLAEVQALEVISKHGIRLFSRSGASLDSLARALDADLLVTGNILRSRGRLRVNIELIDASSRATVETISLERAFGELFSLLDELSYGVSTALRVELGREVRLKAWRSGTTNVEAWRLLQRAIWQQERSELLRRSGAPAAAADALREADSLLAAVEGLDPRWVEPIVLRGQVAKELGWVFLLLGDPARQHAHWEEGVRHADRALGREETNAAALEIRGVLRYLLWLAGSASADSMTNLLASAEKDLRRAVALDAGSAHAWSSLSTILYSQGDFAEAHVSARRAYEADAYLDNAQEILDRLVLTSIELGDDAEARRWCAEIRSRFSRGSAGAFCSLNLLAWSTSPTETSARAIWRIVEEVDSRPQMWGMIRPQLDLIAASALARIGLRDSAEAVIRRARGSGSRDPELLRFEAAARTALGQKDAAVRLLTEYVRAGPMSRLGALRSRIFLPLRDHPGFPKEGALRTSAQGARPESPGATGAE